MSRIAKFFKLFWFGSANAKKSTDVDDEIVVQGSAGLEDVSPIDPTTPPITSSTNVAADPEDPDGPEFPPLHARTSYT